MLTLKKFNTDLDLLAFLRGNPVVSGSTGENTINDGTFSDAVGTPFADVQVGDVLYISGISASHAVTSVTNDNTIEVTPNIASAHAGPGNFARYRVLRGGRDIEDFVVGPLADPGKSGATWGIYDEVDFD